MRRLSFASSICCMSAVAALAACSNDTGPSGGGRLTGRLAAGANFTCALDHTGAAFCWGAGAAGQLGNGARSESALPVRVSGGPYVALTATDQQACGLRADGKAECWGIAIAHCCAQALDTLAAPSPVTTSTRFSQISIGELSACGIDDAHHGFCWGDQSAGGLGSGVDADTALPPLAPIAGGHAFASLSEGVFGGCGLDTGGLAWCWGANLFGELGTGDDVTVVALAPVAVSGGLVFSHLAVGGAYVCGITTTGLTECWGVNVAGALGDSTMVDHSVPAPVVHANFVAIFAGGKNDILDHTCGLDPSGAASCWGANDFGQLGAASSETCHFAAGEACSTSPLPVSGGLTFTTLALGDAHTCGVVADGHVYCWGRNDDGELGDGTTAPSAAPVLSQFVP
jgi:alpha-tubulin suppressor-like RCC1 family protein